MLQGLATKDVNVHVQHKACIAVIAAMIFSPTSSPGARWSGKCSSPHIAEEGLSCLRGHPQRKLPTLP
eukprot:12895726-Prorocentrum_lima.AAC.1